MFSGNKKFGLRDHYPNHVQQIFLSVVLLKSEFIEAGETTRLK